MKELGNFLDGLGYELLTSEPIQICEVCGCPIDLTRIHEGGNLFLCQSQNKVICRKCWSKGRCSHYTRDGDEHIDTPIVKVTFQHTLQEVKE